MESVASSIGFTATGYVLDRLRGTVVDVMRLMLIAAATPFLQRLGARQTTGTTRTTFTSLPAVASSEMSVS